MAERILVTGGEGFLGRHVQHYLRKKEIAFHSADLVGNPTWRMDVTDPIDLSVSGYTRVIHLAGLLGTHELFEQAREAIDVNIHGTLNVLELCRREGATFQGITMDHVWVNPYETTKLAAERLAEAWGREFEFPVKYTTVYNAFGEYQAHGRGHPQKIVPTFAHAALTNQPIPIWGDGTQVVDMVYAGDVAKILVEDLPYDGGTGIPRTVLDVANDIWGIVHPGQLAKVEHLPMRRGEHTPLRDPVARNPIPVENLYDLQLQGTVGFYSRRIPEGGQ